MQQIRVTLIFLAGHGTYHKMICKGSQSRKTSFLTGKTCCRINFQLVFFIFFILLSHYDIRFVKFKAGPDCSVGDATAPGKNVTGDPDLGR